MDFLTHEHNYEIHKIVSSSQSIPLITTTALYIDISLLHDI